MAEQDLRDVSQVLDDEMQSLSSAAHAPQNEDLLPDKPSVLAHLEGGLQRVPLATY